MSFVSLNSMAEIFGAEGLLAQSIPGFRPRSQQTELAEAIAGTIAERSTLVAEAGTGTGKTFAYLAPAIASGGKVLVSTGTKTLQDQLFTRDLPTVRQALKLPVTTALLKGRSNYVCHYHLERLVGDGRLGSRLEAAQLRKIEVFAGRTRTGDKAELSDVPENAEIWNRVTSTRDNCLGSDCPCFKECFVMQARREAAEADIVVVNHALFLADLALKGEGIAELLPAADTVIFDEAHQLPAAATRFLGESISSHQLMEFARDATLAGLSHARESADWAQLSKQLEQATREFRLSCASVDKMPGGRCTFEALPAQAEFLEHLQAVIGAIDLLSKTSGAVGERHPDLELISKRGPELIAQLARWQQSAVKKKPEPKASGSQATEGPPTAEGTKEDDIWVRWVETTLTGMRLHSAPLSVANIFSRHRPEGQSWILTSATLSVRGDFTHFTRQLGLWDVKTGCWASPFDYAEHARLFVPFDMPAPQDPQFTERFVDLLLPLLESSQGSALVLCTTLRAVDRVAEMLAERFEAKGVDWPLFKQGERSRRELLHRFRTSPHAVLVGSASFWEGIDVPGDALTLVAIDKLPFAPPDDPVLEARIKACKERGGNAFFEYQLPEAAIALKQGAGRLIRTEKDWGVLMVADRRLVEKPYGKLLWRGLPPFGRTRVLDEARDFLESRTAATA